MALFKVGNLDSLRKEGGNVVIGASQPIAVFHADGRWHAIENRCPHRDVPLEAGTVRNGEVICPLHGARFELSTGRHQNPPATCDIKTYPLVVVEGVLFVEAGD